MPLSKESNTYIDPELAAIYKSKGRPRPFFPDAEHIQRYRAQWRAGTKRFTDSKTVQEALREANVSSVSTSEIRIQVRDGSKIDARAYHPPYSLKWGSYPLVVFFHGGGFCLGGLDTEEAICKLFCAKLHAVVLNVAYRLAPEHSFPSGVDDAFDAVVWASTQSVTLGADLAQGFVVGGISAGATFASVVAHLWRDQQRKPAISGVFMSVPILSDEVEVDTIPVRLFEKEFQSLEDNANDPILNAPLSNRFWSLYKRDNSSPSYSPFLFESHAALPRTYFQTCGHDPYRDGGLIYARLLQEAGVETQVDHYPGLPHAFWSVFPTLTATSRWIASSIAGMAWLLRPYDGVLAKL